MNLKSKNNDGDAVSRLVHTARAILPIMLSRTAATDHDINKSVELSVKIAQALIAECESKIK